MKIDEPALWTIDELRDRVAEVLSEGYEGVPSGRVRDVPDLRTIRYYTTLGLLDRPSEMRGRTALYGRRHLLQLVSIKRLQAEGRRLSEIQEQLIGLSSSALETMARAGRDRSFWKDPPSPTPSPAEAEPPASASSRTIDLGSDVTVSFPSQRPLDSEDLRVIRLAAAPLLEFLKLRGLIPHRPGVER